MIMAADTFTGSKYLPIFDGTMTPITNRIMFRSAMIFAPPSKKQQQTKRYGVRILRLCKHTALTVHNKAVG